MKASDALPKSEAHGAYEAYEPYEPHEASEPSLLLGGSEFCSEHYSGFFAGSPLLHPELPYRSYGQIAEPLPYALRNDDLVTGSLLLCFLMLTYVVNRMRRLLVQQTRDFFATPKEHTGLFAVETSSENQARLFSILQLCLIGGLLVFGYSRQTLHPLLLGPLSPYILLSIYVGSFAIYFLAKRILTAFINWIFFPKSQQKIWNDSYSYLISVESIFLFFFAIIFVYFELSLQKTLWILLFLLFIIKFLLAFRTLRIFFPKTHGIFHLFAYLCALELIPLLAFWKSLAFMTDSLIVKF